MKRDATDRKIPRALQFDGGMTSAAPAGRVGLSPPPGLKRGAEVERCAFGAPIADGVKTTLILRLSKHEPGVSIP